MGDAANTTEAAKAAKIAEMTEKVREIVTSHLDVDAAKVTNDARFIEDLGADSLDTVELVMAIEEEFECSIPDNASEGILTVSDAVNYLVTDQESGQ